MGLLFPDDKAYDMGLPQTGFNRYKQLLSERFGIWFKVNLITILGILPLLSGMVLSIASSSVVLLLPLSALGGLVFGPFLAGMYDAILRGMRDDPQPWWDCYLRSWKQNFRQSLLPGALTGLFFGLYSFMGMLFYWAQVPPSWGTLMLYLFSGLLFVWISGLYWPQLVLFNQKNSIRLRNILLFSLENFWRVLGLALAQLLYWGLYLLLAPWSVLLLPILGIWYILFLHSFGIYSRLDAAFQISEQFY